MKPLQDKSEKVIETFDELFKDYDYIVAPSASCAAYVKAVDCAGMRLQEATDALEAFGSIYLKQTLASGMIPQITAVFGTCGGGMAIIPALTDFTFIESQKGKMFVNSPNALDGNYTEKCDTSAAAFQSEETGLVDGTGSEEEILGQIRQLIGLLPSNFEDNMPFGTRRYTKICTGVGR